MINRIINAINLHNGGGKPVYICSTLFRKYDNLLILDYRFGKIYPF